MPRHRLKGVRVVAKPAKLERAPFQAFLDLPNRPHDVSKLANLYFFATQGLFPFAAFALVAALERHKNSSRRSESPYVTMDSIQVPYIGNDGKIYISYQPKISPACHSQPPPSIPQVVPLPHVGYTLSEMIKTFESRQKMHEGNFVAPASSCPDLGKTRGMTNTRKSQSP